MATCPRKEKKKKIIDKGNVPRKGKEEKKNGRGNMPRKKKMAEAMCKCTWLFFVHFPSVFSQF